MQSSVFCFIPRCVFAAITVFHTAIHFKFCINWASCDFSPLQIHNIYPNIIHAQYCMQAQQESRQSRMGKASFLSCAEGNRDITANGKTLFGTLAFPCRSTTSNYISGYSFGLLRFVFRLTCGSAVSDRILKQAGSTNGQ